ncbi:hypothetical protein [Gracilibacillus massiliensis]|uniref:hypothetical protein n=1 Tax=Gracilibacillus massiliensis TaxID=1564956 RepID=UPI0011DE0990|nr:hypothetical protein [Gracilibacillus massiliensis]
MLLIFLVGCDSEVEKFDYQDQTNDNHVAEQPEFFNYIIIEITEDKLEIAPIRNDLDVSYSTEILSLSHETKVEGKKRHINDLKIDDRVDVWTKDNDQIEKIKVKEEFDNTY